MLIEVDVHDLKSCQEWVEVKRSFKRGGSFCTYSRFLLFLTVELWCLQSVEVLSRRTFPLHEQSFYRKSKEGKSSQNIKFLGGISCGRPGGYLAGRPGPTTPIALSVGRIKFFARTSLTRRRGRP